MAPSSKSVHYPGSVLLVRYVELRRLVVSEPHAIVSKLPIRAFFCSLVLCFVPETKALSLEELDQVFEIPTRHHAAWGLRQIPWFIQAKIFRRDVPKEDLYEVDPTMEKTYAPAGEHHGFYLLKSSLTGDCASWRALTNTWKDLVSRLR